MPSLNMDAFFQDPLVTSSCPQYPRFHLRTPVVEDNCGNKDCLVQGWFHESSQSSNSVSQSYTSIAKTKMGFFPAGHCRGRIQQKQTSEGLQTSLYLMTTSWWQTRQWEEKKTYPKKILSSQQSKQPLRSSQVCASQSDKIANPCYHCSQFIRFLFSANENINVNLWSHPYEEWGRKLRVTSCFLNLTAQSHKKKKNSCTTPLKNRFFPHDTHKGNSYSLSKTQFRCPFQFPRLHSGKINHFLLFYSHCNVLFIHLYKY